MFRGLIIYMLIGYPVAFTLVRARLAVRFIA
jgi:TRAP-type mannitol/chloroaromatic compound transport system permease large subunit